MYSTRFYIIAQIVLNPNIPAMFLIVSHNKCDVFLKL